jgi:hypothetical protein
MATPHREAPSSAGDYGVIRGFGDCRRRHWRGRRQRGTVESATATARPGGLGPTAPASGMGSTSSASPPVCVPFLPC